MSRTRRFACAAVFLVASTARAELVPQLGGLVVYDTDLHVSWLADTAAITGSAFDDGDSPNDGLVTWGSALTWVTSLTVGGFTDWRLPATPEFDATCDNAGSASGHNCTGSELGHIFHLELSGQPNQQITTSGDPDLALFPHLDNTVHWSKDTDSTFGLTFAFDFSSGTQGLHASGAQYRAWAVRDGPVEPLGVPSLGGYALALLMVALLAAASFPLRRRGASLR